MLLINGRSFNKMTFGTSGIIKIQIRPVSIHITKLRKWAFGWNEAHNLYRAHNILFCKKVWKAFHLSKVKWPTTNVKRAYGLPTRVLCGFCIIFGLLNELDLIQSLIIWAELAFNGLNNSPILPKSLGCCFLALILRQLHVL